MTQFFFNRKYGGAVFLGGWAGLGWVKVKVPVESQVVSQRSELGFE